MNEVKDPVVAIPVDLRKGKRPCFVDGRCSTKTYLVVASKTPVPEGQELDGAMPKRNLIGIRKLGENSYRWHAYPNWAFYNMEQPMIASCVGHNHSCGYDTAILTKEATRNLYNQLNGTRGLIVAPEDELFPVMDRGYDPNNDAVDKSHR